MSVTTLLAQAAPESSTGGLSLTQILFVLVIAIVILVIYFIVRSNKKTKESFRNYQQKNQNETSPYQNINAPIHPVQDSPSIGFAALSFFLPIVGLILFLVWHDTFPFRSRSAGKGALFGVITWVTLIIAIYVIYFYIIAKIVF